MNTIRYLKTGGRFGLGLWLAVLVGCEKESLPPGCFQATVISIDCAITVKIKGGNIGVPWRGLKNCTNITNLPEEAKRMGGTFYFTSYENAGGPFCTADRAYDHPVSAIEIHDYSATACP